MGKTIVNLQKNFIVVCNHVFRPMLQKTKPASHVMTANEQWFPHPVYSFNKVAKLREKEHNSKVLRHTLSLFSL